MSKEKTTTKTKTLSFNYTSPVIWLLFIILHSSEATCQGDPPFISFQTM